MAAKKSGKNQRSMSDAAVAAKTGRKWAEWFAILDKAGAMKLAHQAIATLLHEKHKLPGWWAQMVTVEYERARGLRKKHETAEGYAASVSKTFQAPAGALYRAWTDAAQRRRWLGGANFEVTTATPNKSLRILWEKGPTRVDVYFYPKGAARCQMNVQHRKLASAKKVAESKAYWSGALGKLEKLV